MLTIKNHFPFFAVIMVLFVFAGCVSSDSGNASKQSERNEMISGMEAIQMAEQFIIDQGYTDLPVSGNSPIKFENGEFASDTSKIMGYRKNTVWKKAVGAKQHGSSWTVGFEYVNKENNIGRAVTMDSLGINIIMQPSELRLDWLFEVDPVE